MTTLPSANGSRRSGPKDSPSPPCRSPSSTKGCTTPSILTAARALQNLLNGLRILGIDQDTCQVFGKERGRLRRARTLIGDFDLLIGATALRHDLTLFTNNRRDFERIEGLRIESV